MDDAHEDQTLEELVRDCIERCQALGWEPRLGAWPEGWGVQEVLSGLRTGSVKVVTLETAVDAEASPGMLGLKLSIQCIVPALAEHMIRPDA